MARRSLLIASLIALPMAASAAGFDTGDEGWTTPVAPVGGTQTWQASGGNGGGWLQVEDLDGNSDILLTAPAAWLGDWSTYLGGTLSFDARNVNGASTDWAGFGEVRITGAAGSVLLDIVPAGLPPVGGGWARYSVSLTPAADWRGASLASVLANVTSLTINGEFHAGPGEVVGFDNIQVTAVPEPASAALLLGGLALLASRRRAR
ncbi:PEP-CTERM sorting domain-containing protein [Roseateles sp. LYH14W]|uniref:PEP-CTERM sorting domain-containing protein n=1 Tax=Pelomonas parva TaxID=3299032 RepID=A0ABW7F2E3_9BURK